MIRRVVFNFDHRSLAPLPADPKSGKEKIIVIPRSAPR